MTGEIWRDVLQVGKETSVGVPAPATRKIYVESPTFTREREARPHKFAVGSRDNVRSFTLGPITAGGSVQLPMSADELLEWLAVTVQGGVSPTSIGSGGYGWVFRPSTTLDSMTIERFDGARYMRLLGVRGNSMTIAGSVAEQGSATFDLFATNLQQYPDFTALTSIATSRTPDFVEGWETRLYIADFGTSNIAGTGGVNVIPGTLINWNISFNNNLARKYFADNTLQAGSTVAGELEITATLLFEAASDFALEEVGNWDSVTKRVIRLELGTNKIVSGATPAAANEVQTVTITGTPTGGTFKLGFRGVDTGNIAYNATAGTVQLALEALNTIGTGNVSVTGGPGPGTPYVVTFDYSLANRNLPLLTADETGLTGGTTPDVTVTETTEGAGTSRTILIDMPGAWSAIDFGQDDNGTRAYQLSFTYVYDPALPAIDASTGGGFVMTCINGRPSTGISSSNALWMAG